MGDWDRSSKERPVYVKPIHEQLDAVINVADEQERLKKSSSLILRKRDSNRKFKVNKLVGYSPIEERRKNIIKRLAASSLSSM